MNIAGVANIYSFGEMDFHKVLVMDLLGPSLESYFQDCGRHFSIKTVCMLAIQMVRGSSLRRLLGDRAFAGNSKLKSLTASS